jgi:hypothetical protein
LDIPLTSGGIWYKKSVKRNEPRIVKGHKVRHQH